ncbi:MAG: HD domain-containing protein [Comamonadaceae bacterium]|nr:MAG: HD domain-containing protein [Comamonadaceae bacterium]
MALTLSDIEALFDRRGGEQYSGESVTQLEHALQTAQLAEYAGAGDELVTAALLHDLGHLLNDQGHSPSLRGIDDQHQYFAIPFLRAAFPDTVLDPIRWHVDAKRYLCATRPGYEDALSTDSKRSLALQGGVFDEEAAAAFILRPHAPQAVALRLWDDRAKVAGASTPSLAHFLGRAARCRPG